MEKQKGIAINSYKDQYGYTMLGFGDTILILDPMANISGAARRGEYFSDIEMEGPWVVVSKEDLHEIITRFFTAETTEFLQEMFRAN